MRLALKTQTGFCIVSWGYLHTRGPAVSMGPRRQNGPWDCSGSTGRVSTWLYQKLVRSTSGLEASQSGSVYGKSPCSRAASLCRGPSFSSPTSSEMLRRISALFGSHCLVASVTASRGTGVQDALQRTLCAGHLGVWYVLPSPTRTGRLHSPGLPVCCTGQVSLIPQSYR